VAPFKLIIASIMTYYVVNKENRGLTFKNSLYTLSMSNNNDKPTIHDVKRAIADRKEWLPVNVATLKSVAKAAAGDQISSIRVEALAQKDYVTAGYLA
jgi:hypothetical protein